MNVHAQHQTVVAYTFYFAFNFQRSIALLWFMYGNKRIEKKNAWETKIICAFNKKKGYIGNYVPELTFNLPVSFFYIRKW